MQTYVYVTYGHGGLLCRLIISVADLGGRQFGKGGARSDRVSQCMSEWWQGRGNDFFWGGGQRC